MFFVKVLISDTVFALFNTQSFFCLLVLFIIERTFSVLVHAMLAGVFVAYFENEMIIAMRAK
ncbi:MAG: hypothetical protein EBR82_38235 [Caulobacteraceae bacterium]|nr:hypothetical protein [Caulobacteraceae bacterium]